MSRPDAIEILVKNQMVALIRRGASLEDARQEAEDSVAITLEDLSRMGCLDVYLSVALRRAKVYRMRCQGLTYKTIEERLCISRSTAERDNESELMRRRAG